MKIRKTPECFGFLSQFFVKKTLRPLKNYPFFYYVFDFKEFMTALELTHLYRRSLLYAVH